MHYRSAKSERPFHMLALFRWNRPEPILEGWFSRIVSRTQSYHKYISCLVMPLQSASSLIAPVSPHLVFRLSNYFAIMDILGTALKIADKFRIYTLLWTLRPVDLENHFEPDLVGWLTGPLQTCFIESVLEPSPPFFLSWPSKPLCSMWIFFFCWSNVNYANHSVILQTQPTKTPQLPDWHWYLMEKTYL